MSTTILNAFHLNAAPFLPPVLPSLSKGQNWTTSLAPKKQASRSDSFCDSATTADVSFTDSGNSPASQSPRESITVQKKKQPEAIILNSALKQVKKNVDDTKYKTELCKKFEMTGHCPYFAKCRFAHGKEELNEKALANKRRYKAKLCKNFHSVMNCPYGSRCMFAHEQRTVEELKVYYNQTSATYTEMYQAGLVGTKRMNCFSKYADDETLVNRSEIARVMVKEVNEEYEEIMNLCAY